MPIVDTAEGSISNTTFNIYQKNGLVLLNFCKIISRLNYLIHLFLNDVNNNNDKITTAYMSN